MSMTRDEIMALDAPALNEAIYRAQGYEKLPWPALPRWQKPGGFGLYDEPDYSGSIAAAWGLLEEIPGSFSFLVTRDSGPDGHACAIYDDSTTVTAIAPIAPIAICRAWLLWKGRE